jgi:hypothetical protein
VFASSAALLLLYCCLTAALLLLYCCFTAALLHSLRQKFTGVRFFRVFLCTLTRDMRAPKKKD